HLGHRGPQRAAAVPHRLGPHGERLPVGAARGLDLHLAEQPRLGHNGAVATGLCSRSGAVGAGSLVGPGSTRNRSIRWRKDSAAAARTASTWRTIAPPST